MPKRYNTLSHYWKKSIRLRPFSYLIIATASYILESILHPRLSHPLLVTFLLLVLSVTPFKIDLNKNQNRSIDKVQNLGHERSKCTKFLAKIQGRRIFRIQDIRRNVLPKFIEIYMETPCWCSPGWAPTWRTETMKNICCRVLVQKREFIPRGTHKH